jgi:predicted nuclease with TOPRIM domain
MLRSKVLTNTYTKQFQNLKEEKAELDRHYRFSYSSYKMLKKRLTEMRIEREKLKHPEWFNEKKAESITLSPRKPE